MEKRSKLIDKLKKFYEENKISFIMAFYLYCATALFIIGYNISTTYIHIPLDNTQFEYLEDVASHVYSQGNQYIIEVPDGIAVDRTETTITVSYKNNYAGNIVAKLRNGELNFTRNSCTDSDIFANFSVGFVLAFVGCILIACCHKMINFFNKKLKEK